MNTKRLKGIIVARRLSSINPLIRHSQLGPPDFSSLTDTRAFNRFFFNFKDVIILSLIW